MVPSLTSCRVTQGQSSPKLGSSRSTCRIIITVFLPQPGTACTVVCLRLFSILTDFYFNRTFYKETSYLQPKLETD